MKTHKLIISLMSLILIGLKSTWAASPAVEPSAPNICATIEDVAGNLQVLNEARTRILDSSINAPIPCGSWISVDSGYLYLQHREGYKLSVAPGSFFELRDPYLKSKEPSEPMVLLRGQILVSTQSGNPEFQVLTSHSRARIKSGRALILYSEQTDETQLIALDQWASLENRFESDERIIVKTGEATSMSLKLNRVVPETPRAVGVSDVRGRLVVFQLPEKEQFEILERVKMRSERKFATVIPNRKIASVPNASYERHPKTTQAAQYDKEGHKAWMNRETLGGGFLDSEEMLFPKSMRNPASQKKSLVEVIDPLAAQEKAQSLKADQEKKRLLEELSRIKPE